MSPTLWYLNKRTPSASRLCLKVQLRWASHVACMGRSPPAKTDPVWWAILWSLWCRAPKKRCKDSLKKNLSSCKIGHSQWACIAADRQVWRSTVHQAVSSFESNHRAGVEGKRRRKKMQKMAAPNPNQATFSCSLCGHCLSFTDRSHQPWEGLQMTWTSAFINFIRDAKPNKYRDGIRAWYGSCNTLC